MITKNEALINVQGDALGAVWDNGTLEIRTGPQPASPDDAPTGTLLVTIDLPADAFTDAASGTISKNGDWEGIAVADGVAGWGRLKSADNLKSLDLSVGEVGTDAIIDNEDIENGGLVIVTLCNFSVPNGI